MKFAHNFKPQIELKRFNLRVPGFGTGLRKVAISEAGTLLFEKKVFVFNNKIKFNLPKELKLQIGNIYTLEVER